MLSENFQHQEPASSQVLIISDLPGSETVLLGAYIHCPVFRLLIRENRGMFLFPFY